MAGGKGMGKPARAGKSEKSACADAVFPCPSAELLERGLAELGLPESDSVYRPAGIEDAADSPVYRPVGIRGRASIVPLVNSYIRELELFNAVFDLVGAEPGTERGRQDLVVRHILDSLSAWKEIAELAPRTPAGKDAVRIADAGSGAGFPGIPLAIVFPEIQFTLIERMSKRCAFLENCVAMLGLRNVSVLNCEVEKAPPGRADIVVFRAFRPLERAMLRTLLALVRPRGGGGAPGGVLAAWKARREKIDEEMRAVEEETGGWFVRPLAVPFLAHEERHLVVIASGPGPSRRN